MKKTRKTFKGEEFIFDRWGDSIWLKEAKNGELCIEIREYIPDPKRSFESQNAEYMLFAHGLQPELTREELHDFAIKILVFTGYLKEEAENDE